MSLLTKDHRLSVKRFAAIPALLDLPAIEQPPGSVSDVSSREFEGGVDLSEGCLVTKRVGYTHQLIHWVNPIHEGDPCEVVSKHFIQKYQVQLLIVHITCTGSAYR